MTNYIGKDIFLGIDVHKRTYSLTVFFEGTAVKKATIPAKPQELIQWCHKFFPGAMIHSAYEACFCGFYLHRMLEKANFHNIIVNPASIEIEARNRAKTDKRDSYKIAEQLSTNRLKPIHIPSQSRERMRLISRLYETLKRHRHRVGCQIKFTCYHYGLIDCLDRQKISKKWIRNFTKNTQYHPAIKYVISELASVWLFLSNRLQGVLAELRLQALEDSKIHGIYTSFSGVGLIVARHLANELGDMSQFPNEKKLYSFVGLTPREYSSGDRVCLGHITHQGNSLLRKVLIQCAWVAIKKDDNLKEFFDRISLTGGKKRAIVAVARKLLGKMRACQKKGVYCEKMMGITIPS